MPILSSIHFHSFGGTTGNAHSQTASTPVLQPQLSPTTRTVPHSLSRMTSPFAESSTKGRPSAEVDGPNTSSTSSQGPTTPTRSSSSLDAPDREDNPGGVNEQSPLLSPEPDGSDRGSERHGFLGRHASAQEPDEFQSTKSLWYLLVLTISIGGLQIAWSVELSNGSPYLMSLGLSKSLMALVWIAGPLSGTLVQPYVGMLSDNCRVPWGKRKPFMLGGAAATIVSLMILSWTKDIVGGFLSLFGADPTSQGVKVTTIVVAVIWVYILDFAINTGGWEPYVLLLLSTTCQCH